MPDFTTEGRLLHYREQGEGPLLLVLAGDTSSSALHLGELEHFGRAYHAVALDYWGTGRSARAAIWPDDRWEKAALDTLALLDHLGTERALVVGASGGGIVGLLAAALASERVEAVVADSCVTRLSADWVVKVIAQREAPGPGLQSFWRRAHGEDWADVVRADTDLMRRQAAAGGIDVLRSRLGQVRCPVLFTASIRDDILPSPGEQLCQMVRETAGSRLFLTDHGSHPLMWSRPQEFRAAADWFLREVRGL